MADDKNLVEKVRDIVTNPDSYPSVKGADRDFLTRLCEAQDRSGNRTLTGRQRNIIEKILNASIEPER